MSLRCTNVAALKVYSVHDWHEKENFRIFRKIGTRKTSVMSQHLPTCLSWWNRPHAKKSMFEKPVPSWFDIAIWVDMSIHPRIQVLKRGLSSCLHCSPRWSGVQTIGATWCNHSLMGLSVYNLHTTVGSRLYRPYSSDCFCLSKTALRCCLCQVIVV